MGFSSFLQGPESHDAIIWRQNCEIKLLENIKRCLFLRVKSDREYAIALNAFVSEAQKVNASDLIGSKVAMAWVTFIGESNKYLRYLRDNSDYMASSTMDKLNLLCSEKKSNLKQYQDEYNRIYGELSRFKELVSKTRYEYERCRETFLSLRLKVESMKNGGSKLRRDDFVGSSSRYDERLTKSSRKLHLIHNEYILLLSEANQFEHDMRTILLPGLLEHQQAIQEDMIGKWKIILQDFQRCCNLIPARCHDMQARIDAAIAAVHSANAYWTFAESYRSEAPLRVQFVFEQDLLIPQLSNDEHVSSSKLSLLPPDVLYHDEDTSENLRFRLTECEARLVDCQQHLKEKQSLIIQYSSELDTIKFKTDDAVSVSRYYAVKKANDSLKKEVNEIRCLQQKLNCQIQLIQSAMSNKVDVHSSSILKTTASSLRYNNNRNTEKPYVTDPSPPLIAGNTDHVGPTDGWKEKNDTPSPTSSSVDSTNNATNISAKEDLIVIDSNVALEEELWFHGVLPRGEVVRLLCSDGDFLVRETLRNDEKQIVLSVMWGSPRHFIVQTSPEGHYRFEGPSFATVQQLISHQYKSESPVTSRTGAILKTVIKREKWELKNDDIELVEKIGRGNFGDVFRARLKSVSVPTNAEHKPIEVAVKTCKVTLPEEQKKKFLQEGRILKQYDHPNIVRFIGICVQKQPIMIVMELVPGGSLLNYLRTHRQSLDIKHLLGMCLDAAGGMRYLESKNCIHRDLAARNCLVGDGIVVKLSDFGMSREEEEYTVSDGLKQIPIKWTAPEALNYGKYTSLCDVWSFGVLCWEIFSKGGTPYQGLTNTRTRELLDSGYRMPSPDPSTTPEEMYSFMLRCWNYVPEERPHFAEIHSLLDLLYSRYSISPETRV